MCTIGKIGGGLTIEGPNVIELRVLSAGGLFSSGSCSSIFSSSESWLSKIAEKRSNGGRS